MKKIQNFFKKHSSLIIVVVALLIALVNYLVYPTFIKRQMELVDVVVANQDIHSNTEIKEEMLTTISVTKNLLPEGIVSDRKQVVGKYLQSDYGVSKNGFFYKNSLISSSEVLGQTFVQLKENESAYVLKLEEGKNPNDTLRKGQFIDLYYSTEILNEGGKNLLVGKLKDNVRVLDLGPETLTVAILESEVSDFILAEQTGKILPIVNQTGANEAVYDVAGLRSYLNSENIAIRYELN